MKTIEAFTEAFKKLLPNGYAWNWKVDPDSTFSRLVKGIASNFYQIDIDADAAFQDRLPQYTTSLLEDWEEITGLPGPCMELAATTSARRATILAKLRVQGKATPAYLVQVGLDLGYTITIEEYTSYTCEDNCEEPLGADEGWNFIFAVHGVEYEQTYMACTDACTSPLAEWESDRLQCMISTIRPAHLWPVFDYV